MALGLGLELRIANRLISGEWGKARILSGGFEVCRQLDDEELEYVLGGQYSLLFLFAAAQAVRGTYTKLVHGVGCIGSTDPQTVCEAACCVGFYASTILSAYNRPLYVSCILFVM
jgi:hypothetical protein